MPRIIETTVYGDRRAVGRGEGSRPLPGIDEAGLHDEWYDFVYEDFEAICKILGVTLAHQPRCASMAAARATSRGFTGPAFRLAGRRRVVSRAGAHHAPGVPPRPFAPMLPRTGNCTASPMSFQEVQRRNFFQILGDRPPASGRYHHEYTMAIEVERDSPTWQPPTDDAEDTVIEAMRDLARWLYRQLRAEYEHQSSDETRSTKPSRRMRGRSRRTGEYFV